MTEGHLVFCLLATLAAGCSSSQKPDGGVDSGPEDAGIGGGEDAGEPDGGSGCATAGYSCSSDVPCCDVLEQVCDPVEGVCVFAQSDGGGNGLFGDGAQWQEETVTAQVASLDGLSIPSPALRLAVGTGPGLGQLVLRSADAGWSVVPGIPPATALNGVWADPSGDVFAVGQQDGGLPLWIEGNLDGGWRQVDLGGPVGLDGGSFSSLDSVLGLGPGEALAVGTATFATSASALHLLPDGGLVVEAFPVEVSRAYGLTSAVDGGAVYALGAYSDTLLLLTRAGGAWSAMEVFGAGATSEIVAGADGTATILGDDGMGHGRVFTPIDGGYFPVQGLPAVPPLTAGCEIATGEFYFAASATNQPLELLHVDGGLQNGVWWSETLPADAQTISAIACDGPGSFYAVGARVCPDCPGSPMALRRVP